jgi:hypothetical protein
MKSIGDRASRSAELAASARQVRRSWRLCLSVALVVALSGCAAHYTPEAFSDPYGFFSGVWHGFVFPYALLANIASWLLSLIGVNFLASIEIVGRPNTGIFFYYIGFALGLSTYGGARGA